MKIIILVYLTFKKSMTYRSYYTPPSDGIHVLNTNQTAILILKNSNKMSDSRERRVYNQFKMLETQIASISGSNYSSTLVWVFYSHHFYSFNKFLAALLII